MSGALLKLKGVSAGYRSKRVLQNVDMDVPEGGLAAIIGPNGSGKTTLLKVATCMLKPWSGDVLFKDRSVWDISRRELARSIAVVSQSVEPVMMTVYEYILLGRFPYYGEFQLFESAKDQEIADKYMELTDTTHLKDASMAEISGGERQLVQIARALAQEPSILFLDEPTSHLDIAHQVKILDLIARLNRELGLTVVMVLHDLNLASEYCTKLVLLSDGGVYKAGSSHEVLTYEIIEEVYKTPVVVEKNPLSGKPFVLLVTADEIAAAGKGN